MGNQTKIYKTFDEWSTKRKIFAFQLSAFVIPEKNTIYYNQRNCF